MLFKPLKLNLNSLKAKPNRKVFNFYILFLGLIIPSLCGNLEVHTLASNSINPSDPAQAIYNTRALYAPDYGYHEGANLLALDLKWQKELQNWMQQEIASKNLNNLSVSGYDKLISETEADLAKPYAYPSASHVSLSDVASGRINSPFNHVTVPATNYCYSFQKTCSTYKAPSMIDYRSLNQ